MKTINDILLAALEREQCLRDALAKAQSKAHILKYTKNAVSKQCQADADELFVILTKALSETKL